MDTGEVTAEKITDEEGGRLGKCNLFSLKTKGMDYRFDKRKIKIKAKSQHCNL